MAADQPQSSASPQWAEWVLETARFPRLRAAAPAPSDGPRVLLYTSSNVGLGHLIRVLGIGRALKAIRPDVSIMKAVDAPLLPACGGEDDIALLGLPGYEFESPDSFKEKVRGMQTSNSSLARLRENILMSAVQAYRPNVILMETTPFGKRDELRSVLEYLNTLPERPVFILEMRDIPFVPGEARIAKHGLSLSEKPEYADYIFIAGDKGFFNLAEHYGWPDALYEKIMYVGFSAPASAPDVATMPDEEPRMAEMMQRPAKRLVVTFGGGWDVASLADATLEAHRAISERMDEELQLFLFTGPAAEKDVFAQLEERAAARPDIYVTRFSNWFQYLLRRCDAAFVQAGSTPFEIMETDIPMVVYTRDFVELEQQFRAELISHLPNVNVVNQDTLESKGMTALLEGILTADRVLRKSGWGYDCYRKAAHAISCLLPYAGKEERPSVPELEEMIEKSRDRPE